MFYNLNIFALLYQVKFLLGKKEVKKSSQTGITLEFVVDTA